jgi:hypothetical protein
VCAATPKHHGKASQTCAIFAASAGAHPRAPPPVCLSAPGSADRSLLNNAEPCGGATHRAAMQGTLPFGGCHPHQPCVAAHQCAALLPDMLRGDLWDVLHNPRASHWQCSGRRSGAVRISAGCCSTSSTSSGCPGSTGSTRTCCQVTGARCSSAASHASPWQRHGCSCAATCACHDTCFGHAAGQRQGRRA